MMVRSVVEVWTGAQVTSSSVLGKLFNFCALIFPSAKSVTSFWPDIVLQRYEKEHISVTVMGGQVNIYLRCNTKIQKYQKILCMVFTTGTARLFYTNRLLSSSYRNTSHGDLAHQGLF